MSSGLAHIGKMKTNGNEAYTNGEIVNMCFKTGAFRGMRKGGREITGYGLVEGKYGGDEDVT